MYVFHLICVMPVVKRRRQLNKQSNEYSLVIFSNYCPSTKTVEYKMRKCTLHYLNTINHKSITTRRVENVNREP